MLPIELLRASQVRAGAQIPLAVGCARWDQFRNRLLHGADHRSSSRCLGVLLHRRHLRDDRYVPAFVAGSIAFLKLLWANRRVYYRPKWFVIIAGMIYRMKQHGAGLANICILSSMVLVTLSTTVSLYVGSEDALQVGYPRSDDSSGQSPRDRCPVGAGPDQRSWTASGEGIELGRVPHDLVPCCRDGHRFWPRPDAGPVILRIH